MKGKATPTTMLKRAEKDAQKAALFIVHAIIGSFAKLAQKGNYQSSA